MATTIFMVVVCFAALWTMPLVMLTAGMTVSYSLHRRTAGEFVRERIKLTSLYPGASQRKKEQGQ